MLVKESHFTHDVRTQCLFAILLAIVLITVSLITILTELQRRTHEDCSSINYETYIYILIYNTCVKPWKFPHTCHLKALLLKKKKEHSYRIALNMKYIFVKSAWKLYIQINIKCLYLRSESYEICIFHIQIRDTVI